MSHPALPLRADKEHQSYWTGKIYIRCSIQSKREKELHSYHWLVKAGSLGWIHVNNDEAKGA